MPDKILTTLVSVIATLNALHAVDHILRGDVHWPLDGPSVVFVLITVVPCTIAVSGSPRWEYHRCPVLRAPPWDLYPSEGPVVHIL